MRRRHESDLDITVAVMGATGRTGRRLARSLLRAGATVRGLGRSAARLKPLFAQGVHTAAGDVRDVAYLTEAFSGADVVYALLPYDLSEPGYLARQREQGVAMAEALRQAGVPRVVFLSSLGADQPFGIGMIQPLYEQEQRLAELPAADVLVLRAGDFMENRAGALACAQALGRVVDALPGDLPVPMVATQDIAEAALQSIASASWRGFKVRELLGPADVTMQEVCSTLGGLLGLPELPYEHWPDEQVVALLRQSGFAPDTAELTVQIYRAVRDGRIASTQGRAAATGTPTSFAEFAPQLLSLTSPGAEPVA